MAFKLVAIGLVALAGSAAAPAESWRAGSSGLGATAYIDTDSIRREGDLVHFRREVRWPEVRSFGDGTRYDRLLSHYQGDCRAMTLRSLAIRVKLGDSVVLSVDEADEIETASPGSTAEVDLRAACFGEWPAAR